jgi:hypothetical protein
MGALQIRPFNHEGRLHLSVLRSFLKTSSVLNPSSACRNDSLVNKYPPSVVYVDT